MAKRKNRASRRLKQSVRSAKKKVRKHSRGASKKPKHRKAKKVFAQRVKKLSRKKHQKVFHQKKIKPHHHRIHSKAKRRIIAHHKVAPHLHGKRKLIIQVQSPPVVFIKPDVNDLICRGYSPREIVHKYRSTPTDFALSYVHPKYLVEANFSLEQLVAAGRVRWHAPLGSHSSNYNEAFNLCRYLTDHHVSVESLRRAGAKLSDLAVGAVDYPKLKSAGFGDRDILGEIRRHFAESDNAYHWAHLNFERLSAEGLPADAFIGFESLDFLAKRRVPLEKLIRVFSPKQLLHYFKPQELISNGISIRRMEADGVSLYWLYHNGVPLSEFKKAGFSVIALVSREHDGYLFEHYVPLSRVFPPKEIEQARKQGFAVL